ncbi:hypothetical protein KJ991_03005 [Patescibacteria group bacterium]|nr:hypothetical protein [Patescibacteria group bacterium]
MVWRLFATKLATGETMEGVAVNMRAPDFYPTTTQTKSKTIPYSKRMPTHKVGMPWKFRVSEVDAWVQEGNTGEKVRVL